MELALEMARHRAARGGAAPGDRGPLARAALDAGAPSPPSPRRRRPRRRPAAPASPRSPRISRRTGVAVTVADLPAPAGGLAVAKVFVPGLRPLPGGRPAAPGDAPGPSRR